MLIKSECRFFQKPASFSEECVGIVIAVVLGNFYKYIQDNQQLLILGAGMLSSGYLVSQV